MGQSVAPIPPVRYPSIPYKDVTFFHNLMSETVPDTIIWFKDRRFIEMVATAKKRLGITDAAG